MPDFLPAGFEFSQRKSSIGEYYVAQDDVNAYAIGDVVKTTGTVFNGTLPDTRISRGMMYVTKAAPGDNVRGVIVGVAGAKDTPDNMPVPGVKKRPYTVLVNDNPYALWEIQANNTERLGAMGGVFATYVVGEPTGSVSSTRLDASSISDTAQDLLIHEVVKDDGAYSIVRVSFVYHEERVAGLTTQQIETVLAGATGSGTVSLVSVVDANGISGSVVNPTTTPAITLSLGDITPSSVTATGTVAGSNLTGTNTGDQTITLSNDVTGSGTGAISVTIANNAVTNAKAAQMPANTLKGNNTGNLANAADLTATQATAMLNVVVGDSGAGGTKGLVPAPAAGDAAAGKFLSADGTYAVPAGAASGTVTSFAFSDGGGFDGTVTDATTTPTLALTLADTGVTAGTYTGATVTVDAKGRILFATNGGGLPAVPVDFKDSVDVATTANLTLSGEQTIDGVLTSASRVLVKNQSTASQNGIYVTAAGAWSRATDADTSAEVTSGMLVYVSQGIVSAGLVYLLATADPITLGTTDLAFVAIQLPFSFFINKTVAGTTYTHVLLDSGRRLVCTNAGTKTITVAPQNTVNSAVNTEIEVFNAGAGLLTIAPGSGVTINALNSVLTVPQYHCVKLKKRSNPNTWDLTGFGLTLGTGIAAALATNTGSAGAPVLFNGAGGTPSSLTLTNATGLPVAGGGTGVSSLTAYAPIFGGTTSTGAVQSGTVGTAGQVFTSNGPGAIATFQDAPSPIGRHAVYIAAGSMSPSVTGGCAALAGIASASNQPDIRTLDFDATTQEYAQFSIVMPKSWDEGTLTFIAHWSHAATTTNFGVVWDLQAVAVSNDDTIAVAYGTAQTSTDTGGTTNDLYSSPESSAITVAGSPAAEDMVFFRLSRVTGNGSDTMAIDARLHGITVYMTTSAATDA